MHAKMITMETFPYILCNDIATMGAIKSEKSIIESKMPIDIPMFFLGKILGGSDIAA